MALQPICNYKRVITWCESETEGWNTVLPHDAVKVQWDSFVYLWPAFSMLDVVRLFYDDQAIFVDIKNGCILMVISDDFLNKLAICNVNNVRYTLFRRDGLNYLSLFNVAICNFISHIKYSDGTIEEKMVEELAASGPDILYIFYLALGHKRALLNYLFSSDSSDEKQKRTFHYERKSGIYALMKLGFCHTWCYNAPLGYYPAGLHQYEFHFCPWRGRCVPLASITKYDSTLLYNMLKDNDYDANDLSSCLMEMVQFEHSSEICKIICDASASSVFSTNDMVCHAVKEALGVSIPKAVIAVLMDWADLDERVIILRNQEDNCDLVVFGL